MEKWILEKWVRKLEDVVKAYNLKIEGSALLARFLNPDGYGEYAVVEGGFRQMADDVEARLRRDRYVVIAGPRGAGKSTFLAWLLWNRLRPDAVIPLRISLDDEMRRYLLNVVMQYPNALVLYDPSPPVAFDEWEFEQVAAPVLEDLKFLEEVSEIAPVIAAVPSEVAPGEIALKYGVTFDARRPELAAAVLREYAQCDPPAGLAERAARHPLIAAALAGVMAGGCKWSEAEAALEKARGDVFTLALYYVDKILGASTPGEVRAFSRLIPLRYITAFLQPPYSFVIPLGLVERWFRWEGLPYRRGAALLLAQKQHPAVEAGLGLLAIMAAYEVEPKDVLRDFALWITHGVKHDAGKFKRSPFSVAEFFLSLYGDRLREEVSKTGCWRRIAYLGGLVQYTFDAYGGEPCAADGLFVQDGEFTPLSLLLLTITGKRGVYAAFADKSGEALGELEAFLERWRRGETITADDAYYALGLSLLLASASVGREAAGRALRAAALMLRSIYENAHVKPKEFLVYALSPLGGLAPNEWALFLAMFDGVAGSGNIVREELRKIRRRVDKEWARAFVAMLYSKLGEDKKACEAFKEVRDRSLRLITEAMAAAAICGGDKCKRMEKLAEELGGVALSPALEEFLKVSSELPVEEAYRLVLRNAFGLVYSALAACYKESGDLKKVAEYSEKAAEIFRELAPRMSLNPYIFAKFDALKARAALGEAVADEFRRLLEDIGYGGLYVDIFPVYLAALAAEGRAEEALELLRRERRVVELSFRGVPTLLFLKALGLDVSVGGEEVFNLVRDFLIPGLSPAVAAILGARVDPHGECARTGNPQLCLRIYEAVAGGGGGEAVEVLRRALSHMAPPDLLSKASVREMVLALASPNDYMALTLLLWALAAGDKLSAKLIAETRASGKTGYRVVPGEEAVVIEKTRYSIGAFFKEVAEAVEPELLKALTKLYFYGM
ncbi:MAG: hypothetical protein QW680_07920 [Pyrobaculum sp.]